MTTLNTILYWDATCQRYRSTMTGRFVSTEVALMSITDDEYTTDQQDWYFPGCEPTNPEDMIIAFLDNDTPCMEDFMEGTLSEIEEWAEFHNQWEEEEEAVVVHTHTHTAPTDTVFPEDEEIMEQILNLQLPEPPKAKVLDERSTVKSINYYRQRKGLEPITSLKELN